MDAELLQRQAAQGMETGLSDVNWRRPPTVQIHKLGDPPVGAVVKNHHQDGLFPAQTRTSRGSTQRGKAGRDLAFFVVGGDDGSDQGNLQIDLIETSETV